MGLETLLSQLGFLFLPSSRSKGPSLKKDFLLYQSNHLYFWVPLYGTSIITKSFLSGRDFQITLLYLLQWIPLPLVLTAIGKEFKIFHLVLRKNAENSQIQYQNVKFALGYKRTSKTIELSFCKWSDP